MEVKMVKYFWVKLVALGSISFLMGCAAMQPKPQITGQAFIPQQIQMTGYEQRTNNFLVLLDASGSMGEKYNGQTKFTTAEQVVSRMNQTIPAGMRLNAAVRTFGAGFSSDTKSTYGPEAYSKGGLEASLGRANYGGYTPIGDASRAGGEDLSSMSGNTAVILVSDGKKNTGMDAAKAAQEVKNRYGDKVCFYTVLVGDDPAGKELMDGIARIGKCGFATTADSINSSKGMAGFVQSVFLAEPGDSDGDGVPDNLDKCPGTPKGTAVDSTGCPKAPPAPVAKPDSDGDGVPDDRDKCPNTPKGATVNADGCWAYQGEIFFDVNSATVKSDAYPMLDEAVRVLRNNPDLKVEIQGHTDNTGTAKYNLWLSQKRAESAMNYLVDKGIDPGRLTAKGYGFEQPVASNDTPEGRAKNRRVEFRAPQ
jgi:OmpA-OmpF porin, OOP family